jgi:hypothetical protein
MEASGQQESAANKAKLEFGIWRTSFQRAYSNWANAPHDLKNPLLLTGQNLARAENWLLNLPNQLSRGEKRFIIRSIAMRSGSEADQSIIRETPSRIRRSQRQVGIQWLVFGVLGAAIWILAPDVIQSGMRTSVYGLLDFIEPGVYRPKDRKGTPKVAATKIPDQTDSDTDVQERISNLPTDEPDYDLANRPPLIANIDMGKLERSTRLQRLRQLVELSDDRLKSGDFRVGALLALEAAKHFNEAARRKTDSEATSPARDRDSSTAPGEIAPSDYATVAETQLLNARALANIRAALSRRTSISTALLTEFTASPSAMFCPEGKALLTVPAKDTIEAWDPISGRRIMALTGRRSLFRGASFDPSCERVILTGDDHVAEIFSLADGHKIAVLEGHEASVLATAWSKDGTTVLTASQDTTARLWDARTGRMAKLLDGHENFVIAAALSPDGGLALTASSDKSARIWNARTGKLLHVLDLHRGIVTDAAFSPDGRRILTTSWDGEARIWLSSTGKLLRSIRSNGGGIMTARFADNGHRLLTMTQRSLVQVWNVDSGSLVSTLSSNRDSVRSFDLVAGGDQLVTISWKGNVKLWSTNSGAMIAEFGSPSHRTQDIALSADGDRLTAMMEDGALESWPLFAGLDQATRQVRRNVGQCLSSEERGTLGLPPQKPEWCRDNAG